jgi:hypothetical protein
MRALKPDELVVFRVFNDHLTKQIVYIICIYMILFFHT